jgi:hypothetical protein
VAQAKNKFNEQGELTDATAIDLVKKKLQALKDLILQQRNSKKNSSCLLPAAHFPLSYITFFIGISRCFMQLGRQNIVDHELKFSQLQ